MSWGDKCPPEAWPLETEGTPGAQLGHSCGATPHPSLLEVLPGCRFYLSVYIIVTSAGLSVVDSSQQEHQPVTCLISGPVQPGGSARAHRWHMLRTGSAALEKDFLKSGVSTWVFLPLLTKPARCTFTLAEGKVRTIDVSDKAAGDTAVLQGGVGGRSDVHRTSPLHLFAVRWGCDIFMRNAWKETQFGGVY